MAINIDSQRNITDVAIVGLQPEEIRERVETRLAKYKSLNALEVFAMFLGMAQVLEMRLKQLYSVRTSQRLDDIENWPLGRTVTALAEDNLRPDLVELLRSVCKYRNYMAHEYLTNIVMLHNLLGGDLGRLERKHFDHGLYELEQVTVLFDWCEENKAW